MWVLRCRVAEDRLTSIKQIKTRMCACGERIVRLLRKRGDERARLAVSSSVSFASAFGRVFLNNCVYSFNRKHVNISIYIIWPVLHIFRSDVQVRDIARVSLYIFIDQTASRNVTAIAFSIWFPLFFSRPSCLRSTRKISVRHSKITPPPEQRS